MTSFETLLARIASALDKAGIGYMVIGGQAVIIHGQPRLTEDIDITLAASHDQVDHLISTLKAAGLSPVAANPADHARQTNVLPMADSMTGHPVDIVFSDFPYERNAVQRATPITVGGHTVRFITAEDLLIHKLVAGRPIDLQDTRGIWLRKGKTLDVTYIERWLKEFAQVPGLEGVLEYWRQTRR